MSGGAPNTRSEQPGASGGLVLQYHGDAARTGLYVDSTLTQARIAKLHPLAGFSAKINGPVYAQPLYYSSGSGPALLIVATEQNDVLALNADTGSVVWKKNLGVPVPLSALECGNIDPLGVTSTPVIDPDSKTLYLDAMTTPDGGSTKKQLIYALSLADGSVRAGWPIDVGSVARSNGASFLSEYQNQRGGLALVGGNVYVAYGGHDGDCGDYHGWVVSVAANDPTKLHAWATPAAKGGIWAPGGIASDGSSIFVSTGNTEGTTSWAGGDAVIRFDSSLSFASDPKSFFAPSNWQALDTSDRDLGSAGPLLFSVPGASVRNYASIFGKDGFIYLLDPANLGGIGGAIASQSVSSGPIITAPAAYTSGSSTYVVIKARAKSCPQGESGDLAAIRISANPDGSPAIASAWCAPQSGLGSPIAMSPDGKSEFTVISAGAEGDNHLRAFDGITGKAVFDSGALGAIRRYQTPIAAGGRVYLAGDTEIYAFSAD